MCPTLRSTPLTRRQASQTHYHMAPKKRLQSALWLVAVRLRRREVARVSLQISFYQHKLQVSGDDPRRRRAYHWDQV
jgi:hypothetical protein